MVFTILICMIFCHIVDDYYLQGILASMKQKAWWRKQESYSDKYKNDYWVALVMHSISWAFMIMLPIFIVSNWVLHWTGYLIFIADAIIHAVIDNKKANRMEINLVQDQTIHIIQVFITWLLWLGVLYL